MEKRSISSIGFWTNQWIRKYLRGALIGFIFISIPVMLLLLTGNVQLQMQQITPTAILGIVGSLVAFLIQGATEEIVVRGWLFPVLSVRSRIWVGIVVTSFFIWFSSFTKSRYYNHFNIEYNISWCVCSFLRFERQ